MSSRRFTNEVTAQALFTDGQKGKDLTVEGSISLFSFFPIWLDSFSVFQSLMKMFGFPLRQWHHMLDIYSFLIVSTQQVVSIPALLFNVKKTKQLILNNVLNKLTSDRKNGQ